MEEEAGDPHHCCGPERHWGPGKAAGDTLMVGVRAQVTGCQTLPATVQPVLQRPVLSTHREHLRADVQPSPEWSPALGGCPLPQGHPGIEKQPNGFSCPHPADLGPVALGQVQRPVAFKRPGTVRTGGPGALPLGAEEEQVQLGKRSVPG